MKEQSTFLPSKHLDLKNKSEYKFPKHHVAVDCVVFGYTDGDLKILLAHRRFEHSRGEWSLLGGWLLDKETVEEASQRILFEITGLKDIYLEQVQIFSRLDRDPGGRVISIVFYAMIRIDQHDQELVDRFGAKWWSFSNKPLLIFDHDEMVKGAHEKLKQKASYELIGQDFLPDKFTILELRSLYEAIYQQSFDPGNFRKKILSLKALKRLNHKNTTHSKKGAFYFKFANGSSNIIRERIVKNL